MPLVPDAVSIPITSRAQWLDMRRQDITASDIAAVCGVHPERSALQVYLEKTQPLQADNENNLMRRGRWLEPAVLAAVKDQRPDIRIETPGIYIRSPSLRIGCTPDAFVVDGGKRRILQAKVVARSVFESWDGQVPIYYAVQTMTEAALSLQGAVDFSYLACLVVSEFSAELELFEVPWDATAWNAVQVMVAHWWEDVSSGRRPRADYAKDGDALRKLHEPDGADVKQRVDLTGDNRLAELCERYAATGATLRNIEAERSAISAEIVDKLAGIGKAKCGGFNLSYARVDRAGYTVDPTSFNQLRVTAPKGK